MNLTPINLGSVNNIAPGQGRSFRVERAEIAVFRQRDGRLFAVQNRCPHRHGPLAEGVAGDGKIICPLHSHKFDLTTGQGSEPRECLEVYTVTELNGDVILQWAGSKPALEGRP